MSMQRYEGEFAIWGGLALMIIPAALFAAGGFVINPDFAEQFDKVPGFPWVYGTTATGLALVVGGLATRLTSK